jgi:hypothetical protein
LAFPIRGLVVRFRLAVEVFGAGLAPARVRDAPLRAGFGAPARRDARAFAPFRAAFARVPARRAGRFAFFAFAIQQTPRRGRLP